MVQCEPPERMIEGRFQRVCRRPSSRATRPSDTSNPSDILSALPRINSILVILFNLNNLSGLTWMPYAAIAAILRGGVRRLDRACAHRRTRDQLVPIGSARAIGTVAQRDLSIGNFPASPPSAIMSVIRRAARSPSRAAIAS